MGERGESLIELGRPNEAVVPLRKAIALDKDVQGKYARELLRKAEEAEAAQKTKSSRPRKQ